MIVCVVIRRIGLLAALAGREELVGRPVALAPPPGREQLVGELSAAAEAFGIRPGMRIGEALARCPELHLVQADPEAVRARWARVLDRIEGIGATVESDAPGAAFFAAAGLMRLHGGLDGVLATTRRALRTADGADLERRVRIGAAPTRFAAAAAAARARRGAAPIVVRAPDLRGFLAPLPVAMLGDRPGLADLPPVLERLGIRTLGELRRLPRAALAERFGHAGVLAAELAAGRDTPLEARRPPEPVREEMDLPDAASGPQLERALELLVARLLARRERRGRTLRSLAVGARFVDGGSWWEPVALRRPSADAALLVLVVAPRLAGLPAPARSLALEVQAFGPPAARQARLVEDPAGERRARLAEAVRQSRAAAGELALMRVLELDADSRIPERRSALAPFPVEEA